MLSRTLRLAATSQRPLYRSLSTFTPLRNASPEWESLIGGRAGIERRRQVLEQKYQHVLEAKAKQQGLTVEQLKDKAREAAKAKEAADRLAAAPASGPVEAGSVGTRSEGAHEGDDVVKPLPSAQKPNSQAQPAYKKGDSPVKVSKARPECVRIGETY